METSEDKDNVLLEQDSDFDSDQITPEAVAEYIKDNSEEPQKEWNTEQEQNESDIKPIEQPDGSKVINFGTDSTFDTSDEDNAYAVFKNMSITLQDDQHPITQQEKETYITAMLNDEIYKSQIKMVGGKLSVECRDISVYEKTVVQRAMENYIVGHPNTIPSAMLMLLRQCRVPLQIVSVNGRPECGLNFQYDPDKPQDEQLNKDADILFQKSLEMVTSVPSGKYNLYMKALNIFENKLLRMQEHSFDETFWHPAE